MLLFCAMVFATAAGSNAGAAEPGASGLPDSLYWEVSMPPGYVWMNGCGEMGTKKAVGSTEAVIKQMEDGQSEDHISHHPGTVDGRAVLIDAPSLERAIAELNFFIHGDSDASPSK
ncbi:MAG: hypothetical protein AB1407_02525 [Spirochaetota bacterium]